MNLLENQRAADVIANLYQNLEERLMANIIRHVRNYDQPIPTDEWLLQKLAEIGKLNKENIRIISKATPSIYSSVKKMLTEMSQKTIKELEPGFQHLAKEGLVKKGIKVEKSRNIKQVLNTLVKQAKDVTNLCNTTMLYSARDAFKGLVQNTADIAKRMEILNQGTAAVASGIESRQQALRQAIREFNNSGISAFIDKRGRKWTPEAYVNMCMRTTAANCAHETQMARAKDYGIDLIEVDSHPGARPKCAKDQGKIFDRANKSDKYPHWNTSSYGEPDGLLGINCGHHIYPYVEGVSIRRYFPTDNMSANDKLYKQTQVQRALERSVRKQKRECMLFDTLGDEEAFEKAAVKLKQKEKQLKSYVDGNDKLHRRKDREQVVGFDRRVSAKTVGAARRRRGV